MILNRDFKRIGDWASKWKVVFNADKSEEIIFLKTYFDSHIPLMLNEEIVIRVQTHKLLGLNLTFNLDWSVHVHNVCLKSFRKLAVLQASHPRPIMQVNSA